ncbi:hypothetical protein RvY_07107 [Ramazzottius varieornatus]|uniref:Uncharacterized protein n=1 Tax=Ramazzottius varieornatus TaxID=947166 RepID=A0A1D1V3M8_RAMVA|nr:hypothetical protein RvY_07107 [Ramazzottius varieornatus]
MSTEADSQVEPASAPTPAVKSTTSQPAPQSTPSVTANTPSSPQLSPNPTPSHSQEIAVGHTPDKSKSHSTANKPTSSSGNPAAKPKPISAVRSPSAPSKKSTDNRPAAGLPSPAKGKSSAQPVSPSKEGKDRPKKDGDEKDKSADPVKPKQPFYSTVNATTAHIPPRHPSQRHKSKNPTVDPPVPDASAAPADQTDKTKSNAVGSAGSSRDKKATSGLAAAREPADKAATASATKDAKGQKGAADSAREGQKPDDQPADDVKMTRSRTWDSKPAKRPKEKPANKEAKKTATPHATKDAKGQKPDGQLEDEVKVTRSKTWDDKPAKRPKEKEKPAGNDTAARSAVGDSKGQKRSAKQSFPRPVVIGPDGQPVEDAKLTRSKTWDEKPAKRPKVKEKPNGAEAPPESGPQPGPHTVDSVNEAGRYKEYNQVQDPMKNHEAFLDTHYARINKIHKNYGAGTNSAFFSLPSHPQQVHRSVEKNVISVDCSCPKSFGKYRSKFEVIRRWNNINIGRQNYKFFEMLSTAKSHYDNVKCMASYEKMRHAMEHKVKNSKMIARNRRVRLGARLAHPSVTFPKDVVRKVRNGLNGPDMISQQKKLSSTVPSWRTVHGKGK